MNRRRLVVVLLVLLAAGCGRRETSAPPGPRFDPASFDGRRAFEEVRRLVALGPREAGTPGAARAADHLLGRLREFKVAATDEVFTDTTPSGPAQFHNVIGRIPGRNGLIILGSHYDTKGGLGPGFQGANDSGSSTGVLLELARVLAGSPAAAARRPEIWLVFFDGEECRVHYGPQDGFHGSRHLARRLVETGRARDVLAVVVLDMIGDRDLTVTLPRNSTATLVAGVLDAAAQEGVRDKFSLLPGNMGDDHVAFLDAGLPAVDLIDFQYGSAPGLNDYWHTEADRLDKLSPASLQITGRVVLRLLDNLTAGTPNR